MIVLGGNLLKESMTNVGETAASQASLYHPDLCFMGVYAIHPEYGMTIPYPDEVSIKRQLIETSRRVIAPFRRVFTMKFFVDTANVEDIKKANDMGIICGVTTNPSLIAKEGRDFAEVIKEITSIVDGPISGEVKATTVDAEGMIKEGREIAAIHPNMVVKIPMTIEGLKAVKVLNAEGIKTNVTLVFTAAQALLAARAGASYVSPFLGRLDDISMPGIDLIYDITEIFQMHNIETEIIAASVRNPIHVIDCAKAGADIATVPYSVLAQMTKHPLTDQGIAKFQADYKAVFGE